ncbi:hypothetical protein L873DRAFT_1787164 [Choiromyces venosus 120613-1]|uniref:Uncharacterized protein n=1 Tax=Choiromyces venosus 120613-1 TaxID=1336337 RepID=A0A3N4K205_9PEZI|nr:hypothetical protein L873DRAFT_1787164 [Choiromyces venosus 120613-1]
MSPVEFEAETIAWIADLNLDSPTESNDTQQLPSTINLELSVLFDQCSNFDYDPAVFSELPLGFEEDECFLEEIVDSLTIGVFIHIQEEQIIVQAVDGNCNFEPIVHAISNATSDL